jgi:hypothetical protein
VSRVLITPDDCGAPHPRLRWFLGKFAPPPVRCIASPGHQGDHTAVTGLAVDRNIVVEPNDQTPEDNLEHRWAT